MTGLDLKPWSQCDDPLEIIPTERVPPVDADCRASTQQTSPGLLEHWQEWAARWTVGGGARVLALGVVAVWLVALAAFCGDAASSAVRVQLLIGGGCLGAALVLERRTAQERQRRLARLEDETLVESDAMTDRLTAEELPTGLAGVFRNLSHRLTDATRRFEQAEERSRRLELDERVSRIEKRRLEAILAAMAEPVIVTDGDGRVNFVNPAAQTHLGLPSGGAPRRDLAELLPDSALPALFRQWSTSGGMAVRRNAEFTNGERWYSATLARMEWPDDGARTDDDRARSFLSTAPGAVILVRDITRDKESSTAKSEFVSRVAHELRSPLSSIRACVEMLLSGEAADDRTRGEYNEIIETESDRLARLIDNMLNISRIEAGTVRVNKAPLSLSVVVKEAVNVVRPQAGARDISLVEDLSPAMHEVTADRDLLHQALHNLLNNAVKYTPSGGTITVRMSVNEPQRTLSVSVSDTGVGIPESDLPRVFDKFFRVESSARMAKGTGLGLNLVKHLVETVHDGRVTVASRVGQGTTFTIVLPLAS